MAGAARSFEQIRNRRGRRKEKEEEKDEELVGDEEEGTGGAEGRNQIVT
jgi:hypothetical protein